MATELEIFDESKQAGYSPTTAAEARSVDILRSLLDPTFVKSNLTIADKTPNIDGELVITGQDQKPIGKLEVQVKTLQVENYGDPKYQCKTEFLAYCNNSILPVLLIAVNQQNKTAYWVHIDRRVLLDASKRIKGKTVSIPIPATNIIDRSNQQYHIEWGRILAVVKEHIHDYERLLEEKNAAEDRIKELEDQLQIARTPEYIGTISEDNMTFHYSAELNHIKSLRKSGNHGAALTILANERETNWSVMSSEQRYGWHVERAITLIDIMEYEQAAEDLLELQQYSIEPNLKDGYISLGYLIQNNLVQAEAFSRQAIIKNQQDNNAYATLIKIRTEKHKHAEDFELDLPPLVEAATTIQVALARAAEEEGNLELALQIYDNLDWSGIKSDLDKFDLQSARAATLVQSIRYPELLLKGGPETKERKKVEQAFQYLDEAIRYFQNTQLQSYRYYNYINRAIANKLLGKSVEAIHDFRVAFDLKPTYITVRYLILNIPFSEREAWLGKAKELAIRPADRVEFAQLEAEIMLQSNKPSEALTALVAVEQLVEYPSKEGSFYYMLLADVYIQLQQYDSLQEITNILNVRGKNRFEWAVVTSKYAILTNNNDLLQQALPVLISVVASIDQVWARSIVFDILISAKRFGEAAEIYRPICRKDIYTEYSRKFLECLFFAGLYHEAADWLENYIQMGVDDPFLVDILSTIYDRSLSREAAIHLVKKYLENHDQPIQRAKLALLYVAANEFTLAKKELLKVPDQILLAPEIRLLLAEAYIKCEMPEGLEWAYQTVKQNPRLFSVIQRYANLIEQYCRMWPAMADHPSVRINSYVEAQNKLGLFSWVIVAVGKFDGEIGVEDPRFSLFMGKALGESIIVADVEYTIVKILSKYNRLYDEAKDILAGQNDPSASAPPLLGSESDAKVAHTILKEAINSYQSQGLLFELMARNIRATSVDFWYEIIPDYQIPVVAVTAPEDVEYFNDPSTASVPLLFDLFSILLADEVDGWAIIDNLPNAKFVSFSTVRQIEDFISMLYENRASGDHHYYRVEEGEMIKHTISSTDFDSRIQTANKLKRRILDRFKIVEGIVPIDFEAYKREISIFGRSNADLIEAASRSEYCVISEDVSLRGFLQADRGFHCGSLALLSCFLFWRV